VGAFDESVAGRPCRARRAIAPFAMVIEITAVGLNNPHRGIGLQLI
jgi:hypothetical protein